MRSLRWKELYWERRLAGGVVVFFALLWEKERDGMRVGVIAMGFLRLDLLRVVCYSGVSQGGVTYEYCYTYKFKCSCGARAFRSACVRCLNITDYVHPLLVLEGEELLRND